MLTVEVKLNGRLIGFAKLVNQSADLPEISDYSLEWSEAGGDFLLEGKAAGRTMITGHHRKSGAWALVARAAAAILGQKVDAMEGKR
ncbi:MAG: hypothetical protein MUE52_04385 [Tabrizicola sp.]|jgi:hypothetical protein|nr:hypothetical protein [Tabrizicola sp.]